MNDRVVDVMRRICNKPDRITDMYRSGNEYYFQYDKHFFSIAHISRGDPDEQWVFYVYPDWEGPLKALAESFDFGVQGDVPMVAYHSEQYEAGYEKVFRDLYKTLEQKCYNVDGIFEDVLKQE